MEKKLNELTLSELNLEIQGAVYNAVCDAVCDSTEAIADSVATGIGRAEELASDAERACECGQPPMGEDSEPVLGADAERPRPDGGDRRIRVTIDPPGQASQRHARH